MGRAHLPQAKSKWVFVWPRAVNSGRAWAHLITLAATGWRLKRRRRSRYEDTDSRRGREGVSEVEVLKRVVTSGEGESV